MNATKLLLFTIVFSTLGPVKAFAFDPLFCVKNHPTDLSCPILVNAFRAHTMQMGAGVKTTKLTVEYQERFKSFYPELDLSSVEIGYAKRQPRFNATTVCKKIYFNAPSAVAEFSTMLIRRPSRLKWLLHELKHAEQCEKAGSKEEYAYRWMKAARGLVYDDFRDAPLSWDWDRLHDANPMEVDADNSAFTNLAKIGGLTKTPFIGDFNGDGRKETAIYNPIDLKFSGTNLTRTNTGLLRAIPMAGDADGDGVDEVFMYQPGSGVWKIFHSDGRLYRTITWGRRFEYLPFVADVNGDGRDDLIIYRPSDSKWYARSIGGTVYANAIEHGSLSSVPMVGDYNGDGRADFMTYSPVAGQWRAINSSGALIRSLNNYGRNLYYIPLAADFSGNATSDFGLYRITDGNFYGRTSRRDLFRGVNIFEHTRFQRPLVEDMDGNGEADLVLYDAATDSFITQLR